MPSNLDTVNYKLDEIRDRLAKMDEKLDEIAEATTRHDEQIKVIQRGGGSVLAFVLTVLAAIAKDKFHL